MAFPTVASVTKSTNTSGGSSTNTIGMPATVNAGDLLLIVSSINSTRTISTGPSGFTNLFNSSTGAGRLAVYAKDADGSEGGGSVTIVLSGGSRTATHVLRIPAAEWGGDLTNDVDVGTSVTATGASTANPPSVTAGWGSADNLFIAVLGVTRTAGGNLTSGETITNYTDYDFENSTGASNAANVAHWTRALAASSDDPGTTSNLGTSFDTLISNTIVVRPVTVYLQSVSGTMGAATGSLAITLPRALAGVAGAMAGALTKRTNKLLDGAWAAPAGALTKQATMHLAGAWAAPAGTLASLLTKIVAVSGTMGAVSGVLVKRANKPLAGVAGAASGTLVKMTAKPLAGAWAAPTGALASIKSYIRGLTGVAGAVSGVLTKRTNKPLSGTMGAVSGALVNRTNKVLAGAWAAPTGVLTRLRGKPLSGTAGAMTGSLVKRTNKVLSGAWVNPSGSLVKSTKLLLSGAWGLPSGLLAAVLVIQSRGGRRMSPGLAWLSRMVPGSGGSDRKLPPGGSGSGNMPPGGSH